MSGQEGGRKTREEQEEQNQKQNSKARRTSTASSSESHATEIPGRPLPASTGQGLDNDQKDSVADVATRKWWDPQHPKTYSNMLHKPMDAIPNARFQDAPKVQKDTSRQVLTTASATTGNPQSLTQSILPPVFGGLCKPPGMLAMMAPSPTQISPKEKNFDFC